MLLLPLIVLAALAADAQQVVLQVAGGGKATVAVRAEHAAGAPPVTADCPGAGSCAIVLPAPGLWTFTSASAEWWTPPQTIPVPHETAIPFPLLATAPLTGTMAGADGVDELRLRFRRDTKEGEVRCPVQEGRWLCRLPAGSWDIRLRARGYVSHYAWDVVAPTSLGQLQWKRGASLVGRIELAKGVSVRMTDVRVTLGADLSVTPTEKGFFHFEGVAPGEYVLAARAGDRLGAPTQQVVVIADREAELRAPLVLARAAKLELAIMPPLDPDGLPWRVALARASGPRLEQVTESAADAMGRWTFGRAWSGAYEVSLRDAHGGRWLVQQLTVDGDVVVPLPVVGAVVHGTVKMGEKAIDGKVTFRGPNGAELMMEAADDGTFSGRLPAARDDRWDVAVESPAYGVKRTLTNVALSFGPDGGARVDIELPAGSLTGKIVDESGGAAVGWVELSAQDGSEAMLQVDSGEDGTFAVNGLAKGSYAVRALSPAGGPRSSDVQTVEIGEESREITLVVRSNPIVHGRVISAAGPVQGAQVHLLPTDREWLTFNTSRTDAAGRFSAKLPPGTLEIDVDVEAPGFARRMYHTRVPPRELEIAVSQSGGELQMRLPRRSVDPADAHPWLLHHGAMVHAALLTEWSEAGTVLAGPVEAGTYTLCIARNSERPRLRAGNLAGLDCATATVAPFARATLDPFTHRDAGPSL